MKYRVMIVDDEPPFIRSTKRMVENNSPLFEVVGEAYNGVEALEKIATLDPDIIFTDIKMPVMDGITLVKELHGKHPQIIPIIISGYQEFNFAKEALKSGVVEYLLKPVDPEELLLLLKSIQPRLEQTYHHTAIGILKQIAHSKSFEESRTKHFLRCEIVAPFLLRIGSLSGRTNHSFMLQSNSISSRDSVNHLLESLGLKQSWVLTGQDENELLIICGLEKFIDETDLHHIASKMFYGLQETRPITVVYPNSPTELNNCAETINLLYKTLNQCLVIGKEQLLNPKDLERNNCLPLPVIGGQLGNHLSFLAQSKSLELLKTEIGNLIHDWEREYHPQVWMEKSLKQLLRLLERYAPAVSTHTSLNIERQIEDTLFYVTDYENLTQNIWDIIEDLFNEGMVNVKKNNSEMLLGRIESYLKQNMTEPISLGCVCEVFSISQPYLSRLFRKYRNTSFNEYLTKIRVEEAIRLLKLNPAMLFKEIAETVGYSDQHYFSRIFKTCTGKSPSEYKETLPK